jgi:hypothetical protein
VACEEDEPECRDSRLLPSGRDCIVGTSELKEFVDELRGEWKLLWRERIDDRVRAEGIANREYSKLYVERGTVIVATRDYKPPDFVEILKQHIASDAEKLVPPNPAIGGWGKFMKGVLRKQRGLTRRRAPPEADRKEGQQLKKGGRGWLHFRMK